MQSWQKIKSKAQKFFQDDSFKIASLSHSILLLLYYHLLLHNTLSPILCLLHLLHKNYLAFIFKVFYGTKNRASFLWPINSCCEISLKACFQIYCFRIPLYLALGRQDDRGSDGFFQGNGGGVVLPCYYCNFILHHHMLH